MRAVSNRWMRLLGPATGLLVVLATASGCHQAPPALAPQLPPVLATGKGSTSVHLFREVVSFRIEAGKVKGRGFYYFRNPGEAARAFPAAVSFFVASWQGPPEQVQFTHVPPDSDEPLPFVWLERNCPLAQIIIPPNEDYCLRVDWQQALGANRFAYLLRRGQPWDGAREHIRLTLIVPRAFRDVRLNYRTSHKFKTDTQQCFLVVRDRFDPPENLEVTWK